MCVRQQSCAVLVAASGTMFVRNLQFLVKHMETTHCALVVAIEFSAIELGVKSRPKSYFDRALAQPMANQLAFELGKHLPSLDGLGLVWMAACYDQAQILRPGLPLHAALVSLYVAGMRHSPSESGRNGAQVMTLQALRGDAPLPALEVDERLLGGAMVLLPLAIVGAVDSISRATTILEEKLLDSGLADARTALMLNQALGCNVEHARLMTLDDLAAMCAVQLENAGLASVWEILEAAIFRSSIEVATQIGCAALLLRNGTLSVETNGLGNLSVAEYSDQVLQARQANAVLRAHGMIPLERFSAVGTLEVAESFWVDWLADTSVSELKIISDARLGIVMYQLHDADGALVGQVYPRSVSAHRDILQKFSDPHLRIC